MADYTFGVTKVNGLASQDEALTQGLDFWTITTAVNILATGSTVVSGYATPTASQAALDKLIEIISLNGQPVILNTPTVNGSVYTLTFAIEHPGSWVAGTYASGASVPSSGPETLVTAIQTAGVNYGFSSDATLTATLTSSLYAQ